VGRSALMGSEEMHKVHPRTGHEGLGARWGGWSTSRPGRFTPGKDQVPIV